MNETKEKSKQVLHKIDIALAKAIIFFRLNKTQGFMLSTIAIAGILIILMFALLQGEVLLVKLTLSLINLTFFASICLSLTYLICKKYGSKLSFLKKANNLLFIKALSDDLEKESNEKDENLELIRKMREANKKWKEKYESILKSKQEEPKIKM